MSQQYGARLLPGASQGWRALDSRAESKKLQWFKVLPKAVRPGFLWEDAHEQRQLNRTDAWASAVPAQGLGGGRERVDGEVERLQRGHRPLHHKLGRHLWPRGKA